MWEISVCNESGLSLIDLQKKLKNAIFSLYKIQELATFESEQKKRHFRRYLKDNVKKKKTE